MDTPAYVEIKDRHGNPFCFGVFGDMILPPFPGIQDFRQHREDILNMELNAFDVIVLGYPKTGSHWNWEITNMLLQGTTDYLKEMGQTAFIELTPVSTKKLPPPDQPRVLFTHLKYHHLPKQVFEKKVKLIYLERNPKDTWVSLYNHATGHNLPISYDATWNQFFEFMCTFGFWYGDYFDYLLDWEKVLATQTAVPIITMAFEQLKSDPLTQIERLDQFLGTNRGRELCEKIADACSFTKLKQAKESFLPEEIKKHIFKENAPSFYRKGDVSDWKNWFTVAQNEQFDALYAKRMKNSKLKFIYEL